MWMTRRTFLGAAACAGSVRARIREPGVRCAVVDLGSDCVLRESLAGFAGAMPGAIKVSAGQELGQRQECLFYVVPGAGEVDDDLGLRMARLVDRGGRLVLQSDE